MLSPVQKAIARMIAFPSLLESPISSECQTSFPAPDSRESLSLLIGCIAVRPCPLLERGPVGDSPPFGPNRVVADGDWRSGALTPSPVTIGRPRVSRSTSSNADWDVQVSQKSISS